MYFGHKSHQKGGNCRFVIDDIKNHDETILKDLTDENHYDETNSNPTADTVKKIKESGGEAEAFQCDVSSRKEVADTARLNQMYAQSWKETKVTTTEVETNGTFK